MEIATVEDIERYETEAKNFFQPWITMFEGWSNQKLLIMEFLASKEDKTIYDYHLEKFNKLNHTLAEK